MKIRRFYLEHQTPDSLVHWLLWTLVLSMISVSPLFYFGQWKVGIYSTFGMVFLLYTIVSFIRFTAPYRLDGKKRQSSSPGWLPGFCAGVLSLFAALIVFCVIVHHFVFNFVNVLNNTDWFY